MAVCGSENELVNETLTGLRSTSKGQLRYDIDWRLNAQISSQISFESFLNESTDSFVATSFLASSFDEDNEADEDLELQDTAKTNSLLGIAVNFDIEHERSIKQYYEECRGNVEERKAVWARILEMRKQNLTADIEQKLKSKEESLAEKKRQFEIGINKLEEQDQKELQKRKIKLDREAAVYKQGLDEILMKSLTEESLAVKEREQRTAALENLKKNILLLYEQVLKNIEVIEQKFANSEYMPFVDAQVSDDYAALLHRILSKAENTVSMCKASKDLSDVEEHLELMKKLIQATLSVNSNVENILKLAQEKAREAALKAQKKREEAAEIIRLAEQTKKEEQKKLEASKKLSEKLPKAQNEEKLPTAAHQTSTKDSTTTTKQFREFIADKALVEYAELQEHLNTVQASFQQFISDPKQTKYKFDLQKAVNIPINALSAHSPSHLNDKIRRLVLLLSGSDVEVGGRRVNCKAHPSAMVICCIIWQLTLHQGDLLLTKYFFVF